MSTPIIVIDPRKNRIRFYKSLLQALGSPKYIHLMVNPETKTIAVQSIPKEERGCIVINSHLWKENSYEIYSQFLTHQLFQTLGWIDTTVSYRLKGKVLPSDSAAVFLSTDAEIIEIEE